MHIFKQQYAFIDKFKTFQSLGLERMKCIVTCSHAYIKRPEVLAGATDTGPYKE